MDKKSWNLIFLCWIIALSAMLGSLFFSQVMEFPPCVLCWYQRIAMYPLVLIFIIGTNFNFKTTFSFSFPLVAIGWFIALYHNLLHYGIVPESATPCLEGSSCATVFIDWFGFITIPMLSFIAFTIILTTLIYGRRISNEK